jgi:diacylglycerol kinase
MDAAAVIRRRLRTGNDPLLKAFGFCAAGISHFYETEYALSEDEASLLAAATITLVESYRG